MNRFKEIVKAGYNKIAHRYLAERSADTEDVWLLDDFIKRLPENSKVLDAGCGAGIPISRLLAGKFDVTGVDFSEAQIELAKRHVPNAQFICTDMTQLDFPENTFDGICSYYAIIHLPRGEHQGLLANFHRLLKTGGVALLCLGADDLADDMEENFLGAEMYWSHYDMNSYLTLMSETGFSIIWSKLVKEGMGDAKHLFVLAIKS